MSKRKGLFMQAGILAVTGIIVRIIGLIYRGPLTAILGDEGNGYYGYAYDCYTIALLISSYSIPSAISRIISGNLAVGEYINAQRFFRCALYYVCAVGGVISIILLIFAPAFVADAHAVPVLRIFAPTVFFCGILGVLRGYFQAHRTMVQTSVSQILEQIGNALISILMALALRATIAVPEIQTPSAMQEYETARAARGAMGSALGTGAGVLIGLGFMFFLYMANRPYVKDRIFYDVHRPRPMGRMLRTLISYVTPFILSTCIYNMVSYVNQRVFSSVLNGKLITPLMTETDSAAVRAQIASWYGIFSQKALVLTNIPIAVAAAVSAAMIPEIAALYARRKKRTARLRCNQVIRTTMLIAIPCAVGLAVLSRPVTMLLFPQRESLGTASWLLTIMAVTVVLYSLSTLTNAMLQSAGHIWVPALNSLLALVLEALVLWFFLGLTSMNSYALALAVIVHALLTCLLNQFSVRRYRLAALHMRGMFLAPFLGALVMGVAVSVVYWLLYLTLSLLIPGSYTANLIALIPSILFAIYVYAAALLKTGIVSREELLRFPMGRTLYRIACKTGIYPDEKKAKKRRRKRARKSVSRTASRRRR